MGHSKRRVLAALGAVLLGLVTLAALGAPVAWADGLSSPYSVSPSVIDLGSIEYDSTTAGPAREITITDVSGQNQAYVLADVESMDTPYYSVRLSGRTLEPNGTLTATLTPKAHVKEALGPFSCTVSWMPQLSGNRVINPVTVKGTVVKNAIHVESIAPVTRHFGESVDYRNVTCQTNKGAYTMAELGLTIPNGGADLAVGDQSVTATAAASEGFSVSGNLTVSVKVTPTTPVLTNVKATTMSTGNKLGTSKLSGTATNPWNNRRVEGSWEWMSPDTVMRIDNGQTQQTFSETVKFVPADSASYLQNTTPAAVTVLSSGGAGSPGGANAADPQLSVTGGTWTYDRSQHGPTISTPSTGNRVVTYTDASGASTTNPPVDVGTYSVKVELAATMNYKAATATTTIKINPRTVSLKTTGGAIQSRPYNGTTEAIVDKSKILLDNVYREDGVGLDIKSVVANYASANVGDYTVVIQCPGATLTGAKAANYRLDNVNVSERSTIFKRPARVDFTGGALTKEYGETFNFGAQGSGYTIERGTQSGQSGVLEKDLRSINLTSAGAANASVGTYSVSALGAGANYDLKVNGSGTLKVTQATPYLMSASAGSGKIGSKLSSVPVPTVTYVNRNNGEPVPGTVAWSDPNQTIGAGARAQSSSTRATTTYTYTFSPNNLANYKSVTGTVEVAATAKTPVNITPTRTAFTYDGLPHEVSVATSTAGAVVTTTYQVDGRWVSTPPTNVGQYDFKIMADLPDSSDYADNEIDGVMTISPITPTGQPKVSGDGATLSAFRLDASTIRGVGGSAVSGQVSWDNPGATVKAGDKYAWTFKSSDGNYNDTHGTIIPKPLETAKVVDKTRLQSALDEAGTVLKSAQVSSNGLEVDPGRTWVTNTTNDLLLKAITSANNCMTEGGATQRMVDEALANLATAMDSFRTAMQPGLKGTDHDAVKKQESTVIVPAKRYELKPGDPAIKIDVRGVGNGQVLAFSENDAVATAVADGSTVTITAVDQGMAIVTVSRTETDTHTLASTTIGVVVGEAPADYVPPTEGSVDTTTPVTEVAPSPTVRVRNPFTNEHLYVPESEANDLSGRGWEVESDNKTALASSTPVYRLYNQWSGEHHYTSDKGEYDGLIAIGWQGEGVQFYSDDAQAVKVYRLWNGMSGVGTHMYTADRGEYENLLHNHGWRDEGVGWYYVS